MRDQDLAEKLGTSRTVVREALRRLEDEGLVQTSINRWTRVSSPDMAEAQRIYPILWTLEPLALLLAAQSMTSTDLDEMATDNANLRRALQENDPLGASRAGYDFHHVLAHRSDNPELIRIIDDLKVKLRRLEVMYFEGRLVADRSVEEHQRILTDLESAEFETAARHVRSNWENSLQRVTDNFGQNEDVRGVEQTKVV